MREFEVVLLLLAAVVALSLVARRVGIPYPIVMVVAGLAIGLVPALPHVELDPEFVFLVFLPPILYAAGFSTSIREFKADLRPIVLLAFGLVLFTAAAVAVAANALVPGLGWAAALALGAIVSPPDAVAATAIFQRVGIPRRLVTILEGESLVNDATALTLYRAAVAAMAAGSFSILQVSLEFVVVLVGGIVVGWIVGMAVIRLLERSRDATFGVAVMLLAPYAAYLPAEALRVSGVLAAVVAGLLARNALVRSTSDARITTGAVLQTEIFILNGLVFVLIGLQLPEVMAAVAARYLEQAIGITAAISLVVIVARVLYVFVVTWLQHLVVPSLRRDPPPWQALAIVSWSGLRGVVSLAAALALPLIFPERDLVLFVTFGVILVTLVGQGLTLPLLIRGLGLAPGTDVAHDEGHARVLTGEAALKRIDDLEAEWPTHKELIDQLRDRYRHRAEHHEAHHEAEPGAAEQELLEHTLIRREVIEAERAAAFDLHDRGVIDDRVLRRIERDLDLEELRMEA